MCDREPPLPVTCQTGEPWVDEWPEERLWMPSPWAKRGAIAILILACVVSLCIMGATAIVHVS